MARMSCSFIISLMVRMAIGGTSWIKYINANADPERTFLVSIIPSLLADCLPFLVVFMLHYRNYSEDQDLESEYFEGSEY